MIESLRALIDGKRVMLLGFGMEGRSAYDLISKVGQHAQIGIADMNPVESLPGCVIHSGPGYLDRIDEYDVVFKSPGIVLPKDIREYECMVTSQTELFLKSYRKQVIGITGTKGKSTVASLLFHVLFENNVPCILAGNIGKPVFDIIDDICEETTIILELSSHQLENCGCSPSVSMLLNIYEDHLDRYGTFEKYARAKKNIYLHQSPSDVLYCSGQAKPAKGESVSRTVIVNPGTLPFASLESLNNVKLRGRHNLSNCAFAYIAAQPFGITDDCFIEALQSYTPLRHRLEFIGSKDGIDYYDDSISTTVESTISAIESIHNVSTVIVGGMDRGIDYTALVSYIAQSGLSGVICMYESGRRIYELFMRSGVHRPAVSYCKDLAEAAEKARSITVRGTACILSPASASYGDFANFKERGDAFKRIIFG